MFCTNNCHQVEQKEFDDRLIKCYQSSRRGNKSECKHLEPEAHAILKESRILRLENTKSWAALRIYVTLNYE